LTMPPTARRRCEVAGQVVAVLGVVQVGGAVQVVPVHWFWDVEPAGEFFPFAQAWQCVWDVWELNDPTQHAQQPVWP